MAGENLAQGVVAEADLLHLATNEEEIETPPAAADITSASQALIASLMAGDEPNGTLKEHHQTQQPGPPQPDKSITASEITTPPPPTTPATPTTPANDVQEITDKMNQMEVRNCSLESEICVMKSRVEAVSNELEREVQRRCELEQRFTEEAKRSTDQIEELIAKSKEDDAKFEQLKNKFDIYLQETSSMIENFTANREILTSQLMELRQENDYLLGKFVGKSRDLQNGEINLPQTVEELQFHCLTLNEKLILTTLAREQLEETLSRVTTTSHHQQHPHQHHGT